MLNDNDTALPKPPPPDDDLTPINDHPYIANTKSDKVIQPPSDVLKKPEKPILEFISEPLPPESNSSLAAPTPPLAQSPILAPAPAPSINPVSVSDNISQYNNLSTSKVARGKKPLHWGIYVIAAWNIVGFALSFFSSSQTNTIYMIAMLLDLLLGIGLLFRLEIARKAMVWLAGLLIVLSTVSIILLVMLQHRVAQTKINYNNAISSINQQQLTSEQKQQLNSIQTTLNNEQKQAGKAIGLTYIKESASFVEGLVVIVYLTRPKIKDVFVELPS